MLKKEADRLKKEKLEYQRQVQINIEIAEALGALAFLFVLFLLSCGV